jgi:hypothetical protein
MPENLPQLLLRELHDAVAARRADGADPDETTAELIWRLHRISTMQADHARLHPGSGPEYGSACWRAW